MKLLVANRGEIAIRIMRGAKKLGFRTVAVASEADRLSLHAEFADEVQMIGPSEARHSYLNIDTILQAARASGADAIHPGYGFLSERAEFVDACEEAGIKFVGPSASAMRRLGAKTDSKQLAVENNVPIVPGHFDPQATPHELEEAAKRIGYPVMLKASAGGGGRGMRVVREPSAFRDALATASAEAMNAFGDGTMMVEKLIESPRHIEVQILADHHGNVAALFERECSLQRRHQKLVEEAPSPYLVLRPELWDQMAEAARRLVRASGYTNAGTVEFIVDPNSGEFYFLEVNARLQVEHPVTEAITGIDLVEWQLRIAQGERLDIPEPLLAGRREAIRGHAIEVRVVAEDPARNFLPSVGPIYGWSVPTGKGVRVDTGFAAGRRVPRHYDSLLAKVIVHADDRREALDRMVHALEGFHVLGVHTNIAYQLEVLRHPDVIAGKLDTGFLGREFASWNAGEVPKELGAIVARMEAPQPPEMRAWGLCDGFRNAR